MSTPTPGPSTPEVRRGMAVRLLRQAADEIAAAPADLWTPWPDRGSELSEHERQQARAVMILATLTVSVSHLANSLNSGERAAHLYRQLALTDLRTATLRHLIDCTGTQEPT